MITQFYFKDKTSAVRYVADIMKNLEVTYALTTIIRRGKSEDYFVTSATAESLEDIVLQNSSKQPTNIC